MKYLTFIFLFFTVFLSAQNSSLLYPSFNGVTLITVEENLNWKTLIKSIGDLNKDGINDLVIVLESKNELLEKRCEQCLEEKNKARILLVLLGEGDGFKSIIQNNYFIVRGNEGGMVPYIEPELLIKNNLLSVNYQFTRSNLSYVFKYENDKMRLVSAANNSVHAASGDFESNKYDFNKGLLVSEKGNISEDDGVTETIKIKAKPKFLSSFKEIYSWEVVKGKFL